MTSPSLSFGSALIAFSPPLALLFLLVFRKPQLVILAVCSAFAYLLSALASSVVWLITSSIGGAVKGGGGGEGSPAGTLLALALPGVLCQMVMRCLFVRGYFRVEEVIRRSVTKHEEEERAALAATRNDDNEDDDNANNDNAGSHAETNALQLQLNDLSCSLASGCGYSLLHSLFLYGTLLASESGEARSYDYGAYAGGGGSTGHGGTLFQKSCGGMPSLINGALIASAFSILDVAWMMLSFYGMRRRSLGPLNPEGGPTRTHGAGTAMSLLRGLMLGGFTETKEGGSAALLAVGATHLAASLVLLPNGREDGCRVSLPCLGGVLIWTMLVLRKTVAGGRFLPEDQRRRIRGMETGTMNGASAGQGHHVE